MDTAISEEDTAYNAWQADETTNSTRQAIIDGANAIITSTTDDRTSTQTDKDNIDLEVTRLTNLKSELDTNYTNAQTTVQALRDECDKFKGTESEGYKAAYEALQHAIVYCDTYPPQIRET